MPPLMPPQPRYPKPATERAFLLRLPMRKKGARRKAVLKSYLLLPEQVARYITPLRMSLELLPLGLFSKDHANHVAMIINPQKAVRPTCCMGR